MRNNPLEIMMRESVEEFLARGGNISRSERVLGEPKRSITANYKAGHGKTRMGKNGSGKFMKSEKYWCVI